MKHSPKTTVAILRKILGPINGEEKAFAHRVNLSPSWVNKATTGTLKVTVKAARSISQATGISEDWLLSGNLDVPLELNNRTPYTLQSFERWTSGLPMLRLEGMGFGAAFGKIIGSICAAVEKGEEDMAKNTLWDCANYMEARYGASNNLQSKQDFAKKAFKQMEALLKTRPFLSVKGAVGQFGISSSPSNTTE